MKYQQTVVLVVLVIFCVTDDTVYYIDGMGGSDNNEGTSLTTAFQTIQKCASLAIAGDTCAIRGGTYRETVIPANSGTATQPITFTAWSSNETVTISGADLISGTWSVQSENIWTTQAMTWDVTALNGNQV